MALAVAAVAAFAGCGHDVAEPKAWLSAVRSTSPVHVFGPNATARTNNCDDLLGSVAVAADGTVYVEETTCEKEAGFEGRSTKSSGRPPYVLQVLERSGRVHQLAQPPSKYKISTNPLAVRSDGSLIAFGGNFQLLAYKSGGGWEEMTEAVRDPILIGHSGDGGPAVHAKVENVAAAAVAPDGSVYLAEPYAVRRITRNGTITTVAGTDRFDPPNAELWTWGGRGNTPDSAYPLRPTAAHGPATSVGMPYIQGMTVTDDGTVWLASRESVYRVRDGQFSLVTTLSNMPASGGGSRWLHGMTSDGKVVYVCGPGGDGTVYRLVPDHPTLKPLHEVACVTLAATPTGELFDSADVRGLYRIPTRR